MITINEELLNKYLDDELNREEKDLVKSAIENSAELKRKYETLLITHNLLKNIQPDSPSINFNKMVMQKISKHRTIEIQQKRFLFSILSLFGIIILGVVGYIFYEIISSIESSESSKIVSTYSNTIGNYFTAFFGKRNLSIFGSVLSFIMLISGYFLYDYQKHSKKNFSH